MRLIYCFYLSRTPDILVLDHGFLVLMIFPFSSITLLEHTFPWLYLLNFDVFVLSCIVIFIMYLYR
jgi:hypothetical protein